MAQSAALLVVEVLPERPLRLWVVSFPYPWRLLFAAEPSASSRALSVIHRVIGTHLARKAGLWAKSAHSGGGDTGAAFRAGLESEHPATRTDAGRGVSPRGGWTGGSGLAASEAPSRSELEVLVTRIAERVGRALECQGYLESDAENARLAPEPDEDERTLLSLQGRSISR